MADEDDLLARYGERRGLGNFPSFLPLPPLRRPAEVRNLGPRPGDAMAPVAETLSPTMGAYGLGHLAGDTYLKAREGDVAGAAINLPGLLLAAAPIPGAKRVPRVENPIRAYHGSSHDFDKFDLSKIGTGEGAQAYGHGLYFAENEGVARSYRDTLERQHHQGRSLTDDWQKVTIGGQPLHKRFDVDQMREFVDLGRAGDAAGMRALAGERLQSWQRNAADPAYPFPDYAKQKIAAYEGLAKALEAGEPVYSPKGRMYEVALHATPEQFLDWDKPLSAQSPQVREGMGAAIEAIPAPIRDSGLPAFDRLRSGDARALDYGAVTVNPAAVEALAKARVAGTRYLDQGSRGAGSGTSNYVVWSPEIIEILRKYAVPPAIAGPALATMLNQYGERPD